MAKIQFFGGVSLDQLPAVKEVNSYREQVKKNLGDLVCEYFELAIVKGGDLSSVGQSFEMTIADICRVLELSESEAEEFSGCVEVEIIASDVA